MTEGGPPVGAELRLGRLLKLLQGTIRAAGLAQTEVDERIGRPHGHLSHVFQGRVDLKLIDLFRVLEVVGIEPGRFLRAVFALGGGERAALESLQLVAERPEGWLAPPAGAALAEPQAEWRGEGELLERVREIVRAALAERRGGKPPSPG